jgi:hypothetical protein
MCAALRVVEAFDEIEDRRRGLTLVFEAMPSRSGVSGSPFGHLSSALSPSHVDRWGEKDGNASASETATLYYSPIPAGQDS